MRSNVWILTLLVVALSLVSLKPPTALAIVKLNDRSIDDAVRYGLENQEEGLSEFLRGNWREGTDGTLINIYTPFMQIARSALHRDLPTNPSDEDVAKARSKMVEDIDYIWHHPTVKFMVSMYGDSPDFGKKYFARIEGVGRGRTYTLYPQKMVQQHLAEQEKDATDRPYTAINAYHFNYDQLKRMDEFVFTLYGKNVEPIVFKVLARDVQ